MDQLSKIAFKLFLGMGYDERDASCAAAVLVETDRRGVDTHGLARLGFYHWCVSTERVKLGAQLNIFGTTRPTSW